MLKNLPYQVYSLSSDGLKSVWRRFQSETSAYKEMERLSEKFPHSYFDVEKA